MTCPETTWQSSGGILVRPRVTGSTDIFYHSGTVLSTRATFRLGSLTGRDFSFSIFFSTLGHFPPKALLAAKLLIQECVLGEGAPSFRCRVT